MFTKIEASRLDVQENNSLNKDPFPDDLELDAIFSIWKMMEWIHYSFLEDCNFLKIIEKQLPETWTTKPNELKEWEIRNLERTISYINLASVLDGVLTKLFKQICKVDKKYFPMPHIKFLTPPIKDFKLVKFYRNKVTAHTSYADPRNDSHSMQITSLIHISSGTIFRSKPELFCIGGRETCILGDEPTSFRGKPFSIYEQHPTLKIYFSTWDKIISEALKQLGNKCPIEHYSKIKFSRITNKK